MAVASVTPTVTEEKAEPSVDSVSSSPSRSKPGSDVSSETSSVAISSGAGDSFDRIDQSDFPVQQRHEVDIQASSLSEEYRLLFRLPIGEVLIRDFNCAFQESILFQGHMYLFLHHICFYSNIFGYETKRAIPFHEVTCIRKAKTAAIFPNAIEIVVGMKKYFFASFLSRDEAYRLLVDGWSEHCCGVGAIIDIRSRGNEHVVEKLKNYEVQSQNLNSANRCEDACDSGERQQQSYGEDDISLSTRNSELLANVEDNPISITGLDCFPPGMPSKWKEEDVDAPAVPEYFKKVADSRFSVEVEDFFNFFFSDDAIGFVESFHGKCGDKDFNCTSWSEHEEYGHAREVSFQHPIKIYFGAKFGHCREVQKFRVYRNSHLVIETSQEVSDVPYADYFCVQGLWVVEKASYETHTGCILRVYVNVAFCKKTIWKGKIEQSTIEECQEAYSTWMNIAHELLKQENHGKSEGNSLYSKSYVLTFILLYTEAGYLVNNMVQSGRFALEQSEKKREVSDRKHDPIEVPRVSQVASTSDDHIDENHMQEDMVVSTSHTHPPSESLRKFWSFLRTRNHFSILLVVASLLILLLMQLSIIVLLTRAPQYNIISQLEYGRHVGSKEGGAETIAWFEQRISYLKEEMMLVEARLERMLHEHAMLKAQLKNLEELKRDLIM
ncbi:hypothetical protein Sjap_020119 [Stephania japonica]|uniref:VASt domain-containing protein n=1 Tax=Stephania japonica TaxID=461633 RepID=A0AAP0F030_9MAGN